MLLGAALVRGLVGEQGEGDGVVVAAAEGSRVDSAALEADARARLCVALRD